MELAEIVSVIGQAEMAVEASKLDITDDQVGLIRNSVGDDGPLHARQNGLNVRLVERKNHGAVKRHAIYEFQKSGLNLFERMILVEMFAVDGCDDGDDGRKKKERAIAFVGFNHHVIALPRAGVGAGGVDAATDDKCWIESSCGEYGCDQ